MAQLKSIIELATEIQNKICENGDEWKRFLTASSKLYKYSYDEQILIYAQRPDATACAEMELWNEKMGCWVNKWAKGIAVIDKNADDLKLKYLFDVSDVHKHSKYARLPYLWEMHSEHKDVLINELEKLYGKTDSSRTFEERIVDLARNISDFTYLSLENQGHLNELQEHHLEGTFKNYLSSSVAYSIFSRCGLDTQGHKDIFNFDEISLFGNINKISALGSSVSIIRESILIEIGKIIHSYDKEKYNNKTQEGENDGHNISNDRGISGTGVNNGKSIVAEFREVRSDEKEVFDGESAHHIPGNAADKQIKHSSGRKERRSNSSNRPDPGKNENKRGHKREYEGRESDRMGSENEQPAAISGGNSTEGAYIQLTVFSSIQQQIDIIEAGDLKKSPFSLPDYDNEVIIEDPVQIKTEDKEVPILPPIDLKNYDLREFSLTFKNDKDKFDSNLEAIKTLKTIETEQRPATKEEMDILARYIGWGGLPQAFDQGNSSWEKEFNLLKENLDDLEYQSARASTLNAHYTPIEVVKCIYEKLESFGLKNGNILDPAVGVGYFLGTVPDSMKNLKLYGIELDSISGRMAKLLYPKSNIEVNGFEKTSFLDESFDVAIGNVPFGNYKVADKKYDKLNFMIHDYFFAKSLDKVRAGGLVIFITSKGTMDKKNNQVRKYMAQRAELLGAVRLPNNTFTANAGTEVTSDIIFLKKRDRVMEDNPDWLHLGLTEDNISINQYFIDHPDMILGKMENVSGPYGIESTCTPYKDIDLVTQLNGALAHISGAIENNIIELDSSNIIDEAIPADPNVNNFSFTIVENKVYYRENSKMLYVDVNETSLDRIRGLIDLRNNIRALISSQLEEYSSEVIKEKQKILNESYDKFTSKYGLLNSSQNKKAFRDDSSYYLLCSLEILNDDGSLKRKADIFHKRTIKQKAHINSVDTAGDALAMSLSHKARVDLEYMKELINSHPAEEEIVKSLKGVIFKNPVTKHWEPSDEYLSGNIREKLTIATDYAEHDPDYLINVESLKQVMPRDLEASEIDIRLGATWIEPDIIKQFTCELLKTPKYLINYGSIDISYSSSTGTWNVKGKAADPSNVLANITYGTDRINAYKIIEDTLNLKDVRIFDIEHDPAGKETRVINKKETLLAQQKQDAIKEVFKEWIFNTPERREILSKKYNELFNSSRPREYDGRYLTLDGMNPEITLRTHQLNTAARIIYGNNNTLAAHCVGAGKTYMMIAAAMESKRLGLSSKPLFVVPNHLIEQWTNDFLTLYPGANILASTKEDFEPSHRKKFCSRIATGDYDAIIIGHTQFEKIPLSVERQQHNINNQINEITSDISELKAHKGENFTIKQMEKTKKSLEVRLQLLNDAGKKDNVVTFEELGIDRLFVDEAHSYKNLFLYTKMRNVAGISQTEAQKSSDMFAKCQYMDELTGGKGIIFATGTPISNSMTELYTMMRYLQYNTLRKMNLLHFDSWASTFGETVTAIELTPEGTGYRSKTRFAKFYNIPELITTFKEVADIQTPDMLNLPTPKAIFKNITIKPSEEQKEIVKSLADRAERVRNGSVDSNIDNMLKITNDGRKLALEQRLINLLLDDFVNSKVNECAKNVYEIWQDAMPKKSTQLIFCDLSTPKDDNSFNVYSDIKKKLIARGIPDKEIAFIHDANTDIKKAELFSKVRKGTVRIVLGSTAKMGAGTNVQNKLIALHHLDVPWKPSDIEQQEGRILRQGNENEFAMIFRYITEGTFDAYSWQLIENKQRFISQIMTSKSPVRSCDDIDDATLSYAEVKALATGNPYIKEKMDLDIQVTKLKLIKSNYLKQKYYLEDQIVKHYPKEINKTNELINGLKYDIEKYKIKSNSDFQIHIQGLTYTDKLEAGAKLIDLCKIIGKNESPTLIGEYCGFSMELCYSLYDNEYRLSLRSNLSHSLSLGIDPLGNTIRIENCLKGMDERLIKHQNNLESLENQFEEAKIEVTKPFTHENDLNTKLSRLDQLNSLLSLDNKESPIIDKESIYDDLKRLGYVDNSCLVENIVKLSEKLGSTQSIKDIKILSKNSNIDENLKDLIMAISNEVRIQSHRINNMQPQL